MIKVINTLILCLILGWGGLAQAEQPATKDDIKLILGQMDKRFEQIDKRFEQVDRRFEQVNRRFEQMEERMSFMQGLLYVILTAALGAPFLAEHHARRRDDFLKEEHDRMNRLVFALRSLAKDDPKIKEALELAEV